MKIKESTSAVSREDVSKWIGEKGIEGAKAELSEMANEIAAVMDKVSDIFDKHPECVVFHGLTFQMKVDAHADDVIMKVCRANMGIERYYDKEDDDVPPKEQHKDGCSCGKFGGSCESYDCKKAVSDMIDSLDPQAKMMLAMMAVMGGIKK